MVDNDDMFDCSNKKKKYSSGKSNDVSISGADSSTTDDGIPLNLQICEVISGEAAIPNFENGVQNLCELQTVNSLTVDEYVEEKPKSNFKDVKVEEHSPLSPPVIVTAPSSNCNCVEVVDLTGVSACQSSQCGPSDVIDLSEGPLNDASDVVNLTHDEDAGKKRKKSLPVVASDSSGDDESDNKLPDLHQNQMMNPEANAEFEYWLSKYF